MLKLTLMNHTFNVPCEQDDREKLIEAATLLEDKLDQVNSLKGESKVLMVALNMCYDYLQMKNETDQYCQHLERELESLMTDMATASQSEEK